MSIFCAGLSHHEASVELREKFAVGFRRLDDVLATVCALEGVRGAVVLSTCNRVEFYGESDRPGETFAGLRRILRERGGQEAPWYFHEDRQALRHLLRVSAGLESLVLGETEILGQIKQAYSAAAASGRVSRELHRLFQHAFRAAKHVRTETRLTRGPASIGAVAAELAVKIFGNLAERRVMILGAGQNSEATARALVARGARMVIVSNRHFDRAARLAGEVGGRALGFEHWPELCSEVDILICSTSAPRAIVTAAKLASLMQARGGRSLFVIDLAVPRDVEAAAGRIDGVHLYDMDSLEETVRQTLRVRRSEVARCERLIHEHVQEFASRRLAVR